MGSPNTLIIFGGNNNGRHECYDERDFYGERSC